MTRAAAQLIAYESFTGLPLGNGLPGTGSDSFGWATGWQGAGTTDPHFQIVSPSPALSFQGTGVMPIQGGNRALQITTSPEPLAAPVLITRDLPALNTTYYVSFLFQMPVVGAGSDRFLLRFMNGSTTAQQFGFGPETSGPMFYTYAGSSSFGSTISGGSTAMHLLVFQVRSISTPNSYGVDYARDPGTIYSVGLFGASSIVSGPMQRIGLSVESIDNGGATTSILIDEIRVGYRWSDVVPATAPVVVPSLEVGSALSLSWFVEAGKSYQLQSSTNLGTWTNIGFQFTGSGNERIHSFQLEDVVARFFRVLRN